MFWFHHEVIQENLQLHNLLAGINKVTCLDDQV